MTGLTVLFVVLAVVLTVAVYAFAVRRLLGLRLSPLRAWIGGLIALACASPIITAIGGSIATPIPPGQHAATRRRATRLARRRLRRDESTPVLEPRFSACCSP